MSVKSIHAGVMFSKVQHLLRGVAGFSRRNTDADKLRIFRSHLPPGSFSAAFLDVNGQESWPVSVKTTYEVDMCDGNGLMEGDVILSQPDITAQSCHQLIRNGDAEASDTEPLAWVHERGGVEL